jgi:hypothetical protein
MENMLDRVAKYASAGLSAVAAILFIVLGIKQKEIVLGIIWALVASAVIWLLVAIVKRIITFFRDRGSARRGLRRKSEATPPDLTTPGL